MDLWDLGVLTSISVSQAWNHTEFTPTTLQLQQHSCGGLDFKKQIPKPKKHQKKPHQPTKKQHYTFWKLKMLYMLPHFYFLSWFDYFQTSSGVPEQAATTPLTTVWVTDVWEKAWWTRWSSNATTQVRDTMSPATVFKNKQGKKKKISLKTALLAEFRAGTVWKSPSFPRVGWVFLFRVLQILHQSLHYTLPFHTKGDTSC